ncbi:hypothetical protein P154DRAFT_299892 [Amniculicola lignicola CBS 123094]|uniref:Uncharacterized protein n=1 Tax=Amniculicola lignicola CBS 123094 TaxID=1392246 RepID=A0A6A5W787_9PLEO|nr:hypothetical protein P154DRAFT_299892 [Amniculicola lignicola CBS 123094]
MSLPECFSAFPPWLFGPYFLRPVRVPTSGGTHISTPSFIPPQTHFHPPFLPQYCSSTAIYREQFRKACRAQHQNPADFFPELIFRSSSSPFLSSPNSPHTFRFFSQTTHFVVVEDVEGSRLKCAFFAGSIASGDIDAVSCDSVGACWTVAFGLYY